MNGLSKVEIYTDGAAEPNPGTGGYGIVLRHGPKIVELSRGFRLTTNNRMELMAIVVALEMLKKSWNVAFYSDSMYVVESVQQNKPELWQRKNWIRGKRKSVKNADLWQRFLNASKRHSVEGHWIKGHSGHLFNERCDVLAGEALRRPDLMVDRAYEASCMASLSAEGRQLKHFAEKGVDRLGTSGRRSQRSLFD